MDFKYKIGDKIQLLGWGEWNNWEVLSTRIDYSFKHAPEGIGKYLLRNLDGVLNVEFEFCKGDAENPERSRKL